MLIKADKFYWLTLTETSNVQSLIFDKNNYSVEKAQEWAKSHGFKTGVDEKEGTIRLRQKNPSKFKKFATKEFGKGIKAVIGFV